MKNSNAIFFMFIIALNQFIFTTPKLTELAQIDTISTDKDLNTKLINLKSELLTSHTQSNIKSILKKIVYVLRLIKKSQANHLRITKKTKSRCDSEILSRKSQLYASRQSYRASKYVYNKCLRLKIFSGKANPDIKQKLLKHQVILKQKIIERSSQHKNFVQEKKFLTESAEEILKLIKRIRIDKKKSFLELGNKLTKIATKSNKMMEAFPILLALSTEEIAPNSKTELYHDGEMKKYKETSDPDYSKESRKKKESLIFEKNIITKHENSDEIENIKNSKPKHDKKTLINIDKQYKKKNLSGSKKISSKLVKKQKYRHPNKYLAKLDKIAREEKEILKKIKETKLKRARAKQRALKREQRRALKHLINEESKVKKRSKKRSIKKFKEGRKSKITYNYKKEKKLRKLKRSLKKIIKKKNKSKKTTRAYSKKISNKTRKPRSIRKSKKQLKISGKKTDKTNKIKNKNNKVHKNQRKIRKIIDQKNTTKNSTKQILIDDIIKRLNSLRNHLLADIAHIERIEKVFNDNFEKISSKLKLLIKNLKQLYKSTNKSKTSMNDCLAIEKIIKNRALERFKRNIELAKSTVTTCKDFVGSFVRETLHRSNHIKTLNQVVKIVNKKFNQNDQIVKEINSIESEIINYQKSTEFQNLMKYINYKKASKTEVKNNIPKKIPVIHKNKQNQVKKQRKTKKIKRIRRVLKKVQNKH